MSDQLSDPRSTLHIRNARASDAPAISELTNRVYQEPVLHGYSEGAIPGHIINFP